MHSHKVCSTRGAMKRRAITKNQNVSQDVVQEVSSVSEPVGLKVDPLPIRPPPVESPLLESSWTLPSPPFNQPPEMTRTDVLAGNPSVHNQNSSIGSAKLVSDLPEVSKLVSSWLQ